MKVKELLDSGKFQVIHAGDDPEREITTPFCCDLLSVAMGKAPAGCAWVTVMGNMNTLAVATLADAACIILAEGAALDETARKKAEQQDIMVLATEEPVFEAALWVWQQIQKGMERELSYDLHIHSCLSPCGDDDMTPGNIVGMAAIKGLDVIAVTDHNSCRNCPAVLKLAEQYGVLAIPGMELTTAEEVHAVCLFSELSAAMEFDRFVYGKLMKFPNREEIFGKQQIMNEEDICIGTEPNLLINSTELSFDELWDIVTGQYGGVMIPAHIDKNANSLISNLGFVPPESQFRTAELHDMAALEELKKSNPYLEQCRIICDSDAHYLEHIHEPEWKMKVREKSAKAVIAYLRGE